MPDMPAHDGEPFRWLDLRVLLTPTQVAYLDERAAELGITRDEMAGGYLMYVIDEHLYRERHAVEDDWRNHASRADLTGVQR